MIDGKYHIERTYNHKRIIIDLCDLGANYGDGRYEVMGMYKSNSMDFDSARFHSLPIAIEAFNAMCRKYQDKPEQEPQPLSGKYAKLRDDLKAALAAGKAAEGTGDGGTCNFDACAVNLPRWKEALVKQAAKEAGTNAFTWSIYDGRDFVFNPITNGQGQKRSRNAEEMTAYMKSLGYDAMTYCQVD